MAAAHPGEPGKTAALVAEVEAHRAEISFDFRHLFHLPISELGEGISWAEAVDLVEQLAQHPGSHYWSALRGFTEPTSWSDVSGRLQATAVMNMLREKGSAPIELPMPFDRPGENADVTPEERDVLVEYARATAPFPLDD